VAGGGVSVYFSHTLQLLFFSYTQGKTFAAPLPKAMDELSTVFPISFKRLACMLSTFFASTSSYCEINYYCISR